jgi:hypothetical protein
MKELFLTLLLFLSRSDVFEKNPYFSGALQPVFWNSLVPLVL